MGRTSHVLATRPIGSNNPLERLFLSVPDHYGYCLLRTLADLKAVRFTRLQVLLSVNSRTLTQRLKQLQRLGLIGRRAYRTMPPRVEYSLTDRGRGLARIVRELESWAGRNCQPGRNSRQPKTARVQ